MNDIRVLIVDPHTVLCDGLASLLSVVPGVAIVAKAANGAEAIELAVEHNPDVVLMEIYMPGMNGIVTTREIRSRCPTTRILIVTDHDDDYYVYGALEVGASGYLLKSTNTNRLIEAIHAVYANRAILDAAITYKVIHRMLYHANGEQTQLKPDRLTDLEQEVLCLFASGTSNIEIADRLELTQETVRNHVGSILSKLNARDRAHAVRLATQKGLLTNMRLAAMRS